MGKLLIAIPEKCSTPAIYDAIAAAVGKDPKVCRYDCRYVWVAEDIFQAFSDYMTEDGRKDGIGAQWLMFGPKVDKHLKPGEVRIEDKFFAD